MMKARRGDSLESTSVEAVQRRPAPGKATLTGRLPVQRHAERADVPATAHDIAAAGVEGPGEALPFMDVITRSFGRHDVSNVQAHTAPEATAALGADAYATGHHVAFATASPSLHSVAHEAAHVVQQRAGVQLEGGVGQVGDGYEVHADRVADAVVAGESAEAMLDEMAGSGANGDPGVQRHALQFWGKQHETLTVEAAHRWNAANPSHPLAPGHIADLIEGSDDPDYAGRIASLSAARDAFNVGLGMAADRLTALTTSEERPTPTVPPAHEGPDHGEGGEYRMDIAAARPINLAAVEAKVQQAIAAVDPADGAKAAMHVLGYALHMAQDRGSHWEGAKGMGHADPRDLAVHSAYSTDDPSFNAEGYQNARQYSIEVIQRFMSAFADAAQYHRLGAVNSQITGNGGEADDQAARVIETLSRGMAPDPAHKDKPGPDRGIIASGPNLLNSLSVADRVQYIDAMLRGVCTDSEEALIVQVLETASVADLEAIVIGLGRRSGRQEPDDLAKGIEWLDAGIDFAEWKACVAALRRSQRCATHLNE